MGRDPKHDYKSRCIYHITMGKAAGCPVFSLVSGSIDQPVVTKTHIGKIIESHILNLPKLCPTRDSSTVCGEVYSDYEGEELARDPSVKYRYNRCFQPGLS